MNEKKILILGGSSFVGRHLFKYLGTARAIVTHKNNPVGSSLYFDSLSMSLSEILDAPNEVSHAVILLGDTKPDSCFLDVPKSQALNVDSIKRLLKQLMKFRIKPIFASSHFVFDGTKGGYTEADQPSPILKYADQKVEVEKFIHQNFDDYLIVRLAQVYGLERGDGTVFTNWLEDIEAGKISYCAEDYISCPIFVGDVAAGITGLIDVNANGIFHMGSHEPLSRIELYQALADQLDGSVPDSARAVPCSIHDFDMAEKRPQNISMVADKLVNRIGIKLRDVKSACREIAKLSRIS